MSTSVVPSTYSAWLRSVMPIRVEVRLALELRDPQRDLVRVPHLLVGMLQELCGDRTGVQTFGHVVVALVAEHAHDLRRERLVEHLDHPVPVSAVGRRDRALFDLLPSSFAERLDVGQEVRHGANGTVESGDTGPSPFGVLLRASARAPVRRARGPSTGTAHRLAGIAERTPVTLAVRAGTPITTRVETTDPTKLGSRTDA